MVSFEFMSTSMEGLLEIIPGKYSDDRGSLCKWFEKDAFACNGIRMEPFEEFSTLSKKGVLRGLHFQQKYCQDKLVRVVSGSVYDVAVDLRRDSKTFGNWQGFFLTAEKRNMLYVPKGFAHGFLALDDNTLMNYLCGDRYDAATDSGICYNDPQIAVEWPLYLVHDICISDKDRNLPTLSEFLLKFGPLKGKE